MVKKSLQKTLYQDYDNIIVKCLSGYENSLKQVAGAVAKNVDKHSKILDVGIGTGNLEKIIFQNLPTLRVEGVDVNKKFTAIAKQKFKNKNIAIRLKDIIEFKIKNEEYQAIVSCLSIHHFKNREKQMLFKRIFLGLKKGGVFINYDMTMPENEKKLSEMKAVQILL